MESLLLLLPLLLLAACGSGSGSVKTGTTSHSALSPTPSATATPAPPPTATGVYFRTSSSTVALDPASGTVRWSVPIDVNTYILVATDRVVYTYDNTGVVALRASDGARLWSHAIQRMFVSADGVVYAELPNSNSSATAQVTALNGFTGATLWTSQLVPTGTLMVDGANVIVLNSVNNAVTGVGACAISVLDAQTGKLRWSQKLNSTLLRDDLAHSGVLYLGLLASGNSDQRVVAYRLSDGATLWQSSAIQYFNGLVDADSDRLYLQTTDGLMALHTADGSVAWSTPMESPDRMLLANNVLYGAKFTGATSQQGMFAVNAASGAMLWFHALGTYPVVAPPVLAGSLVYLTTRPQANATVPPQLTACDAASGTGVWGLPNFTGDPIVSNGTLYIINVASYDPTKAALYALNASTGAAKWTYTAGQPLDGSLAVIG